jgi:outer membrane lipoprotein SlyB
MKDTFQVGQRVKAVLVGKYPWCIPGGTFGTIQHVRPVQMDNHNKFIQISVRWDNGQSMMVCSPPDYIEIIF